MQMQMVVVVVVDTTRACKATCQTNGASSLSLLTSHTHTRLSQSRDDHHLLVKQRQHYVTNVTLTPAAAAANKQSTR